MTLRAPLRLLAAALCGLAAALLVSCGGSGKGLIPQADAGPLRSDFEEVAEAARAGNGSCVKTEAALGKTESDFLNLPASVDAALRDRLQKGISNLHNIALSMCAQPVAPVTTATSSQTTPSTTSTQTTPTTSTPTTATPEPGSRPPANEGGGTAAPGEGQAEETPGKGKGKGNDKGNGNGEGEAEGETGGASAGGAGAGGGH